MESGLRTFISEQQIDNNVIFAHRVVHGGALFRRAVVISDIVKDQIKQLMPLAPLHNPHALKLIKLIEQFFTIPIIQIAVFDTAFFNSLPTVARTYAIPLDVSEKYAIHRYGFHGLAHEYMWQQWCSLTGNVSCRGKLITIQLGSGCSISAIKDGHPIDTSMGFSPLEGLVMATRSGDIDPGILIYLQTVADYSSNKLDELLNKHSGLLGLSRHSADIRELQASDNQDAQLALDIYVYRLRKYIGSYLVALGGADGIVLGGGVGENNSQIRAAVLNDMQWCGIKLDSDKNKHSIGKDSCFSQTSSPIALWTIKVNEAQIIAEQAGQLLESELST